MFSFFPEKCNFIKIVKFGARQYLEQPKHYAALTILSCVYGALLSLFFSFFFFSFFFFFWICLYVMYVLYHLT